MCQNNCRTASIAGYTSAKGNEVYVASYLFAYGLDLPAGTKEIRLPANDRIRILAVSVANEGPRATPAGALYLAEYPDRLVVPPPPAKR